jgi:hypothetical protein
VAQVDDRHNAQSLHLGEDEVGELPVILVGSGVDAIVRRSIAQPAQSELAHQGQVLLPVAIVKGLLELVDAHAASRDVGYGRVTALDTGGKHEPA